MALAVVVRPEIRGEAAVGRDAHLRRLVEPDLRAHHAGEPRRRYARGFHVARDANAAAWLSLLPILGQLKSAFKNPGEIAAIVGRADRRLVRHRASRDQIAAPDLGTIDA